MISESNFYGRSREVSFGSNTKIALPHRYWSMTPQTSGLEVSLPSALDIPSTGGPIFYVENAGAHDFDLLDSEGGLVGTIPSSTLTVVLLASRETPEGAWYIDPASFSAPGGGSTTGGSGTSSGGGGTTGGSGTGVIVTGPPAGGTTAGNPGTA